MKLPKLFVLVMIISLIGGSFSPALVDPARAHPSRSETAIAYASAFDTTPPVIDGSIGYGEWQFANQIALPNGLITLVHDNVRLYVLIDMVADAVSEATASDYFWLTFDVNRDGAITPNVDINYGLHPSTGNMRYQYYLGAGSWTGLQPNTLSSRARGYNCAWEDGTMQFISFFPLKFSCNRHVFWELAIDLSEIGAQPGGNARMGLRAHSSSPSFTDEIPANFYTNFSDLIDISLGASPSPVPAPLPAASINLEANALEVTQAIQTRANDLPLVANKRTAARVYVDANGTFFSQPVVAYLYGSNSGVDLPGSPMAVLHQAPPSINRSLYAHTANFQLPTSWDQSTQTFWAGARDFLGNYVQSSPINLRFTAKEVPTYWIVPINTGSNASPTLVADAEIARAESYLESIYPLHDVNFIRKDWTAIGPTTVADTIEDLKSYYTGAVLAWLFTVIITGKEPFKLPDQIYGFTPSGGGISDPTWYNNGGGVVARGFLGTSLEGTMAHEINHNLDRSSNGTWGRHTPFGCGASGADSAWPYANDDIQEVGFDTRLPWNPGGGTNTVIPGTTPDIMSYCQSGSLPTKWISPYRWNNLFSTFTTASFRYLSRIQEVRPVYYLSGVLYPDGTARLRPAILGPGLPTQDVPRGEYSLEVLNVDGKPVRGLSFPASFVDPEGEPLDNVPFNFELPFTEEGVSKVLLKQGDQVLDEIVVSSNAPEVKVVEPNGGEQWSGMQTIRWDASDADGDELSFTVLYSPDGTNWYPVETDVKGDQLEVDTTLLPGGNAARVRVIATDGFNTAQDDSDEPFSLEGQGPQVTITSPEAGGLAKPGAALTLEGQALDLEEADLPEEAFVWTEGDTVLGTGRSIQAVLPPGQHEITLSVTDSQENTGQDTVQVLVGSKLYVPLMMKK